ncbi:MAG: DMT family transporter [Hyphomicrobiales bacterium]
MVWLKQALASFQPISASFLRILLAVILIFLYAVITKKLQMPKKKDLPKFILGGILMPFLFFIFAFSALDYINALLAGIIYATLPLFSPIAGYFFFKEKFNSLFFIGMIISFIGIIVAITNKGFHLEVSVIGIILAFMAIFCYIFFSVVVKKLSETYNETTNIFYTNLIGLIFLIPVFFIFDFTHFTHTAPTRTSIISVFDMAFFSSFIGFVLYAYSIKALGTGKSLILFNLVPIFSTIGAVLVLGDTLDLHKSIGLVAVIVGLVISVIKTKKRNYINQN